MDAASARTASLAALLRPFLLVAVLAFATGFLVCLAVGLTGRPHGPVSQAPAVRWQAQAPVDPPPADHGGLAVFDSHI